MTRGEKHYWAGKILSAATTLGLIFFCIGIEYINEQEVSTWAFIGVLAAAVIIFGGAFSILRRRFIPASKELGAMIALKKERRYLLPAQPASSREAFLSSLYERLEREGFQLTRNARLEGTPALCMAVKKREALIVLELSADQLTDKEVKALLFAMEGAVPHTAKDTGKMVMGLCILTSHVIAEQHALALRGFLELGCALQVTVDESDGRFYMFHTKAKCKLESKTQRFLIRTVLGYRNGRLPKAALSPQPSPLAEKAIQELQTFEWRERTENQERFSEIQAPVLPGMKAGTAMVASNEFGEFVYVRVKQGGVWYELERDELFPDSLIVLVNGNFNWDYPRWKQNKEIPKKQWEPIEAMIVETVQKRCKGDVLFR